MKLSQKIEGLWEYFVWQGNKNTGAASVQLVNSDGTHYGDASLTEQQTQSSLLNDIKENTTNIANSANGRMTPALILTFDNITNTPVADPSNVAQWNTFFSTTIFSKVTVSGSSVALEGMGTMSLQDNILANNLHLTKIEDYGNFIESAGNNVLVSNPSLTKVVLNRCLEVGNYFLNDAPVLEYCEINQTRSSGEAAFHNLPALKKGYFNSLRIVKNGFLNNIVNEIVLLLPNLITAGDAFLKNCENYIAYLPVLNRTGAEAFSESASCSVLAPLLRSCGINLLKNSKINQYGLNLSNLGWLGANAFDLTEVLIGLPTLLINQTIATNTGYLNFKATWEIYYTEAYVKPALPANAASETTLVQLVNKVLSATTDSVKPKMTNFGFSTVQTAAIGTNYIALPNKACSYVQVKNRTGTDILLYDGTTSFPIANGEDFDCPGLTNLNQLQVKRKDLSNTQVTVNLAWWE